MTTGETASGQEKNRRICILLVTERSEALGPFVEGLRQASEVRVEVVSRSEAALKAAAINRPVLVVVDEEIHGVPGLDLVRELVAADAFINTAVISDAAEDDFHLHSEGLGVLSKLKKMPDEKDASDLLELLRRVRVIVP